MRIARALIGLILLLDVGAKKPRAAESSKERVLAEIEASTGSTSEATAAQSPEMAEEEAKARASLSRDVSDALTDIMAVLNHGSDSSKDSAIEKLIELSMATGRAGEKQARQFRSAVVAGGALPALVEVLAASEAQRQYLAASALHALALDDPTTDADNFHQLEICQAGAIEPLVKLLDSTDGQVQSAATGALSTLAENPTCQAMIASRGAVAPLLSMANYGTDMHKLGALSALDVLAVNNADVRQQLKQGGAGELLSGLQKMGSPLLRDEAATFGQALGADTPSAPLSTAAHIKAARNTRVRYDGVRQRAFRMMEGWEPRG